MIYIILPNKSKVLSVRASEEVFFLKIVIAGDPHPMARPRVVQGHVYYLSRDIEWRELIQAV